MSRPRVLLTAGFDRALHVLALAERLRREGVSVEGLLVVSPYSVKRARALVRQRGKAFLWEAVPRLLGRRTAPTQEAPGALAAMMQQHGIAPGSLRQWARAHGVPYRAVPSLNAAGAVAFVASVAPDWVVYGGGGILHDAFIDAAAGRILNAHSGPLPEIRGMNACEWSLLLGHAPAVTVHLINRGIDTGGILSRHPVPVQPGDPIAALRQRCAAIGVEALYRTVLEPPASLPAPLREAAGHRQCFVLAPALRELLESRLEQGAYAYPPPSLPEAREEV